jgi:hypothetical protein
MPDRKLAAAQAPLEAGPCVERNTRPASRAGRPRCGSLAAGAAVALAAAAAHAAPSPVVIARCGDSSIDVTAGVDGGAAALHGAIVTATGERWSFTAHVGMARLGAKTRTITVEDVRTVEGRPARGKEAAPSGLFVDLLLDDKKLLLRHASEGGGDPDYAADLDKCSFAREADGALAALVPPAEPPGCAPDTVRGSYRTQVARIAKLPDADADREARALCEDHQKTIEARNRLEQAISDRAARDRIAARGAAVMKTEDARIKAWNRVDGCLGGEPAKAQGVAALHDAEARTRACYAKISPRP